MKKILALSIVASMFLVYVPIAAPVALADENQPPVVSVWTDESPVTLPDNDILLKSTANDPDGWIPSGMWSQVSGPTTITEGLGDGAWAAPSGFTIPGTYVFRRTVTDNGGASAHADVAVEVVDPVLPPGVPNQPPQVTGWTDTPTVTLPANTVLVKNTSTDPDGMVIYGVWTQESGPNTATIATPGTAWTEMQNLVAGQYIFRITVTDSVGLKSHDDVYVTVRSAGDANEAPVVAIASDPDISIGLPETATWVNVSSTDTDGEIASRVWTQLSGPATATLADGLYYSDRTEIQDLTVAGIYTFRLTATDYEGASSSVDVTVKVYPDTNDTGVIGICHVVLDAAGNIITSTLPAGTEFSISLPDAEGIFIPGESNPDPLVFTAPFAELDGNVFSNDPFTDATAICGEYYNLPAGTYHYNAQTISSNRSWLPARYEEMAGATTMEAPSVYGADENSDGVITLTTENPVKTLVIINQLAE